MRPRRRARPIAAASSRSTVPGDRSALTRSMKYFSGSTSPIARRNGGKCRVGPNAPGEERHRQQDEVHDRRRALGRADERRGGDAERGEHDGADDRPRGSASRPRSGTASRRTRGRGRRAPRSGARRRSASTTSIAATYVDAGSGVARSRLRIASSRRTTSLIARPANAVFAQPYPISPLSSACAAGTP